MLKAVLCSLTGFVGCDTVRKTIPSCSGYATQTALKAGLWYRLADPQAVLALYQDFSDKAGDTHALSEAVALLGSPSPGTPAYFFATCQARVLATVPAVPDWSRTSKKDYFLWGLEACSREPLINGYALRAQQGVQTYTTDPAYPFDRPYPIGKYASAGELLESYAHYL